MKRIGMITILTIFMIGAGLLGFGVSQSLSARPEFYTDGYVLTGGSGEMKQLGFKAGTSYSVGGAGGVQFTDTNGDRTQIEEQSFVHLNDDSIMALSGGILFDFNDLSDNFINNYYISAALPIAHSGGVYTVQSANGAFEFGEHLWKLSDGCYIIQSPKLSVYFADDDVREVSDFIQVTVSEDGIVQMLTAENRWITISESCYIETEGGVQIHPVTQLVENGTYKMSLAKLAVSPDDSIVLTEDETRRQIVPEINIDTVDGEDGENGEDGLEGEVGQDGIKGEAGAEGETGVAGPTGPNGEAGAAGSTGSSGSGGKNGKDGDEGLAGGSGSGGADAGDSSIKTALPTVSVTEWNVGAVTMGASLEVKDPSVTLLMNDANYPMLITITDLETGEKIPCYQKDAADSITHSEVEQFIFTSFENLDGAPVYFTTEDSALIPDHQYALSVTAYYSFGEAVSDTSTIYARELLYRTFYTDSTGIVLTMDEQTDRSISVNTLLVDGYSANKATVLLLTPEQNKNFPGPGFDSVDYTQYYVIDYNTGTYDFVYKTSDGNPVVSNNNPLNVSDLSSLTLEYNALPSDTKYVARVIVEANTNTETINKLTAQQLDVTTLKVKPEWDKSTLPTAIFNRSSGAFEVYPPIVTDTDGGIQEYTFTVYNAAGDVVATKTVAPERLTSASFYLASEEYYTFNVSISFFDNEKSVVYDLGTSEPVQSVGESMPTLKLEARDAGDNNGYEGTLYVNLAGGSEALLDPNNPWTLTLYADQVWEEAIVFDTLDEAVVDDDSTGRYIITASQQAGTNNTIEFDLNFANLLQNVSYTISVNGCVDLNDGSQTSDDVFTSRALGAVSFRTQCNPALELSWDVQDSGSFDGRTLKVSLADAGDGEEELSDERKAEVMGDLEGGQMLMTLYTGTGNDMEYLDSRSIYGNEMEAATSANGLAIQETWFPDLVQLGGSSETQEFTLQVSSMLDYTYKMEDELGYVNEYDLSGTENTTYITVLPSPPDLTVAPSSGVTATPIYNMQSGQYGKVIDASLPDYAVVGYKLQAKYDNGQNVATKVKYYAFEAEFMAELIGNGSNPMNANAYFFSATQDINKGNATPPAVVLFFGDNPNNPDGQENDPSWYQQVGDNTFVYYVGETEVDVGTGNLNAGMGRGYRYVFAYTVEYSVGDITGKIYPDDMSDYDAFRNEYGMGTPYRSNTPVGQGVAYILNSGVKAAPRAYPTVHSFVESSTASINGGVTTGTLTLSYIYEDADGAIIPDTQISYKNGTMESSAPMIQNVQQEDGWYYQDFNYTVSAREADASFDPRIMADWYARDYTFLKSWGYEKDSESLYLTHLPLEWGYGAELTDTREANNTVDVETEVVTVNDSLIYLHYEVKHDENKIVFTMNKTSNENSSAYITELMDRAYGLKVTLTPEGSLLSYQTFLPITEEVGNTKYSAELPLSKITNVEQYLDKRLNVEVSICYDDGTQGWGNIIMSEDIAESKFNGNSQLYVDVNEVESGYFGLQAIDGWSTPSSSDFMLGSYYNPDISGDWSDVPAKSLMVQYAEANNSAYPADAVTLSDFRNAVDLTSDEDDTSVTFGTINQYTNAVGEAALGSYFLYPDSHGMAFRSYASTSAQAPVYLTVKGTGYHTFAKNDSIKIKSLMATASDFDTTSTQNSITLNDMVIHNPETIPVDTLSVAMFSTSIAAGNLDTSVPEFMDSVELDKSAIQADGTIAMDKTFENLTKNTDYYFIVYYVTENGVNVPLLKDGTTAGALYTVSTLGDLVINSASGLKYNNSSYFLKNLSLSYNLDREAGITVDYDIFLGDAETVGGKFADEDVTDADTVVPRAELYTLMGGNVSDQGSISTSLKIDLFPSGTRSAFVPGDTYSLRVRLYENGVIAGYKYYDVLISAADKATSFVQSTDVSSNSITFKSTVSDTSLSYMGVRGENGNAGYGLYTVRFFVQPEGSTDKDVATWDAFIPDIIVTDPESGTTETQVFSRQSTYSMNSIQQSFVLTNLDATRTYAMKIYAVRDAMHTNESPLMYTGSVDSEDNPLLRAYGYAELFGDKSVASGEVGDYLFTDYINNYLVKKSTLSSGSIADKREEVYNATGEERDELQAELDALLLELDETEERIREEDAKFCLNTRSQITTSDSGILIGTKGNLARTAPNELTLYLPDTFGLVQGEEQKITKINLSVIARSGTSYSQDTYTYETPDINIEKGVLSSGVEAYVYKLPEELPESMSYEITVELYSTNSKTGQHYLEFDQTYTIVS